MTKNLLLGIAAVCGSTFQAVACTGISLTSRDGSYVQARTIEWARGVLQSEYVIIPRGQQLTSFTPTGVNGLTFTAKYGVVGLAVVQKEFIAEGINEAGLSAGLFFFPHYGGYETYDAAQNQRTLADLQVTEWLLSQFSTIDEVKAALSSVRVVGLEKTAVVHWRIGEPSGRQVVLEIVGGVPHFYENEVGVLTNAPGFEWQLTNLNNYANLHPGDASMQKLSGITPVSYTHLRAHETVLDCNRLVATLVFSVFRVMPRLLRGLYVLPSIGEQLRNVLQALIPCSNVSTCLIILIFLSV